MYKLAYSFTFNLSPSHVPNQSSFLQLALLSQPSLHWASFRVNASSSLGLHNHINLSRVHRLRPLDQYLWPHYWDLNSRLSRISGFSTHLLCVVVSLNSTFILVAIPLWPRCPLQVRYLARLPPLYFDLYSYALFMFTLRCILLHMATSIFIDLQANKAQIFQSILNSFKSSQDASRERGQNGLRHAR